MDNETRGTDRDMKSPQMVEERNWCLRSSRSGMWGGRSSNGSPSLMLHQSEAERLK